MFKKLVSQRSSGFTLIELLVVIAIIAILAVMVIVILNPLQIIKRTNDARRLEDLDRLRQAIDVAQNEAVQNGQEVLCSGSGNSYPCKGTSLEADSAKADNSGWVKINLQSQPTVSMPSLPTDPVKTFVYYYCADKKNGEAVWEIDAVLESDQYSDKMTTDGGNDIDRYEVGSDLTLIGGQNPSCTF